MILQDVELYSGSPIPQRSSKFWIFYAHNDGLNKVFRPRCVRTQMSYEEPTKHVQIDLFFLRLLLVSAFLWVLDLQTWPCPKLRKSQRGGDHIFFRYPRFRSQFKIQGNIGTLCPGERSASGCCADLNLTNFWNQVCLVALSGRMNHTNHIYSSQLPASSKFSVSAWPALFHHSHPPEITTYLAILSLGFQPIISCIPHYESVSFSPETAMNSPLVI